MASYSAATAASFNTTAGTFDDTTLSGGGDIVRVVHRGTTDPVWVTLGLTSATTLTPTVAGDNVFVVPPGATAEFPVPPVVGGQRVCVETLCASAQPVTISVLAFRRL